MKGLQHTGAFVVQFRPETDPKAGRLSGRIEHVASSEAIRFSSLDELLAFVERILAAVRAEHELADAGGVDTAATFIFQRETEE